jgi:hypothetical protein
MEMVEMGGMNHRRKRKPSLRGPSFYQLTTAPKRS